MERGSHPHCSLAEGLGREGCTVMQRLVACIAEMDRKSPFVLAVAVFCVPTLAVTCLSADSLLCVNSKQVAGGRHQNDSLN